MPQCTHIQLRGEGEVAHHNGASVPVVHLDQAADTGPADRDMEQQVHRME